MLKERIVPVAQDMPQATWVEIIKKCYEKGVDLSAKYMYVREKLLRWLDTVVKKPGAQSINQAT